MRHRDSGFARSFGLGAGLFFGLLGGLALVIMVACGGCAGLAWLGRQPRESYDQSATHRAIRETRPERLPGGPVEPR